MNLKLIKCHFTFNFNFITILLVVVIFVLTLIFNFINISTLNTGISTYNLVNSYFDTALNFITFISCSFSIVIFSFSFLSKQDSYLSYLIGPKIRKDNYFITKVITNILVNLFLLLLEFISLIFPLVINKITEYNLNLMMIFLDILIVMTYYGLLSLLLVVTFDNFYLSMIPIIIYVFSSNIYSMPLDIINILKYVIPFFNQELILISSRGFILMEIVFFMLINLILYIFHD